MSRWLAVFLPLLASGCTVDVLLGVDEVCGGRDSGDSFSKTTPEGCTQECTCAADGLIHCDADPECPPPIPPIPTPLSCNWEEEGVVLAPRDTKLSADSCTTCTCMPDGKLSCADDPCCEAPPPCEVTDPLSGCYSTPICGPMGWECTPELCDCLNQMPPYCPPPPPESGCFWSGVECEADGLYSCGNLICPSCDSWNQCGDPMIPGCIYEPRCDQGVIPTCELVCNLCPDPPPQCAPSNPDCASSTAVCSPMGIWECIDEECPVPCDPATQGTTMCDSDTPGCRGGSICLENNWYCADVCGM